MWMKHPVTLSTANLNGRSNMRLCPFGGVRAALASSLPGAGRASYKPRAVRALSGGVYGEKHQISHKADREIQNPGCKALAPSLSISLQHQNSAVVPPPLPGLALLPLALILSFSPSQRSLAQHHIPARTCTLTGTSCLSPPPFPSPQEQDTQAPVFVWKQPSNREKPTERSQQSIQHSAHCGGSSKQIHSLPQSINISLFSATTLGISCNAIFCVGARTKGQHPTGTSFLSLQFSEV